MTNILNGQMKKYIVLRLVWKIYNEATGVEIGELKELSSFNLESKDVQK